LTFFKFYFFPKKEVDTTRKGGLFLDNLRFGRFAYDWREGVNLERMRKERLEKTRQMMKKYELEALICLDPANVRYITSTSTPPWMIRVPGWRYTILAKDAAPILYEHGDIRHITKQTCPWLEKVKFGYIWIRGQRGPETVWAARIWAEDIKKELEAYGVDKDSVGLDIHEALAVKSLKEIGINVKDGQQPMIDARVIKTKDEINCLKIASAICEAILHAVQKAIKPGTTELELVALGYKVGYAMGMEDIIGFTVCSGPNTWPNFKYYTDRIIRPGDIVTYDIGGASWLGYRTCYYRTFSCGRASEKMKDFYKQAYDWLYSAVKKIKPGATTAEVVADWPDATTEWGYESEWGSYSE